MQQAIEEMGRHLDEVDAGASSPPPRDERRSSSLVLDETTNGVATVDLDRAARFAEVLFTGTGGEINSPEDDEARASLLEIEDAGRTVVRCLLQCCAIPADASETVAALLSVVRNLSRNQKMMQRLITSDGAGSAILQAMVRYPVSPRVLEEACGALVNLASAPANQVALVGLGAGDFVANAVTTDLNNKLLVERGMEVLYRLSLLKPNRRHLLLARAAEAAVEALNNMTTQSVVEKCLLFWGNLASSTPLLPGLKERLEELSVIASVVRAMGAFVTDPSVGEAYCRWVAALCLEPSIRDEFGGSEMEDILRQVMKLNANTHLGLAEWGIVAVRTAVNQNVKNKTLFVSRGGAELVLEAMRAHSNSPGIAARGLSTVWTLANCPDTKHPLVERYAADASVMNAMRLFPEDPDVAVRGCAALASLANARDNKPLMISRGAAGCVCKTLKAFGRERNAVAVLGTSALWSLAMSPSPEDKMRVASADGAVKTLFELFLTYAASGVVTPVTAPSSPPPPPFSHSSPPGYTPRSPSPANAPITARALVAKRSDEIVFNALECFRHLCSSPARGQAPHVAYTIETLASLNLVQLLWPVIQRRRGEPAFCEVALSLLCVMIEESQDGGGSRAMGFLRENGLADLLAYLTETYPRKRTLGELVQRARALAVLDEVQRRSGMIVEI